MLLVLAGCSIAPATANELSSAASDSGAFAETLTATQDLLGGEWIVRDDVSGRYCDVPSGGAGESVPALRISVISPEVSALTPTPTPTPEAAAAAVASAWTEWGYSVTQTVSQHSIGGVTEVQGRQVSGEFLVFRASVNALTLHGESACKPTS